MAKVSLDLEPGEANVILNGLGVLLAQAQRAEKAARTDPVRAAFAQEGGAIKAVIGKCTKAFAV